MSKILDLDSFSVDKGRTFLNVLLYIKMNCGYSLKGGGAANAPSLNETLPGNPDEKFTSACNDKGGIMGRARGNVDVIMSIDSH